MNIDRLQETLHDHIVNEILLTDGAIHPTEDLFEAGFDSMSLSRVLVFVEDEFGVTIPDEDVVVDEIATLEDMTEFVASYLTRTTG